MNPPENSPQLQTPCLKLRSKEMFYQSPGQDEEEFSSGVFWCCKTQENFGPDGQPVSKSACCAGRACYIG